MKPLAAPHPFHPGELAVQRRVGVGALAERLGQRAVLAELSAQHQHFFIQLPFVVAGVRDAAGLPWAGFVCGPPGFVSTDRHHLHFTAAPKESDPIATGWQPGAAVGLLGIELHTRRRNRANGILVEHPDAPQGLSLFVEQSYGNCPRFITPRRVAFERPPPEGLPAGGHVSQAQGTTPRPPPPFDPSQGWSLDGWSPDARRLIETADTFFIASGEPPASDRGTVSGDSVLGGAASSSGAGSGGAASSGRGRSLMDVSHRGGPVGFVEISPDGSLEIPDYAGNNLFNTLGNLEVDERAGLSFVDFPTGRVLQLTGTTRIDWDPPDPQRHPGAQRLLRFTPTQARFDVQLPLRFALDEDANDDAACIVPA